ncbi:MAG: hypothetical protein H6531_00145 [Actinobacteria bacterium]|nr:hypothetical protein [Thermoleophilia bacterium]MCB9010225.1 hypothetical protein [Actinomycetota bacterium]
MADHRPSPEAARWFDVLGATCAIIRERSLNMSPAERARNLGKGAGGDVTAGIDRMAEDELLTALRRFHHDHGQRMTLLSEELGVMEIGGGGFPMVVADPIDGSNNAKRGTPVFCTAVAVATGPTMGDVWLGMVADHGSGEVFTAERGVGAWLNGVPLEPPKRPDRLLLVGVEGGSPARLVAAVEYLAGRVIRVRSIGSMALTLVWSATGRTDGMLGLSAARSVDVAAAQLIATELGCLVGLPTPEELDETPLDLASRRRVTACPTRELLDVLVEALGKAG